MMYGVESLVRPYVPVVARTKQKVVTPTQSPLPDVGIRWGKPSRFEFSNEGKKDRKKQGQIAAEYLGKKEKLEGEEVYRKWDRILVEADTTGTPTEFELERPVEMFFFMREEERYNEFKNDSGNIQPEITTVYHYVKFAFPLNNEDDNVISSGERGEHPDDILAKTQADFDATLQGEQQKMKEYWEGVFEDIATTFGSS